MQNLNPFLFLVFILFVCCNNETTETSTATTKEVLEDGVVDIETFESLMKSDHLLIDVRTPEEFDEGYITTAQNIDFRSKEFETKILKLDKNKPVLVYCKSGGRSGNTYTLLKANNFTKVYDLEGGFTAWKSAKKPFSK